MILDSQLLTDLVPAINPRAIDTFLVHLKAFMPKYGIETPRRIGGFIAQVAVESMNFKYVLERGTGAEYEMNEDLGNTVAGDGVRYKGRGLIQITGKKNYTSCSLHIFRDLRLLNSPQLLTTPQYAVQSACWFWESHGINQVCDQEESWIKSGPHQYTKIQWMTVKVNGGLNGFADRQENYERARTVLNF